MTKDNSLREEIDTIFNYAFNHDGHEHLVITSLQIDKLTGLLMQAFQTHKDKAVVEAELKARLVELDLFEQFLNQHFNKGITRGELYQFKMERLKDLEERIKHLKESGER